MDVLDTLRRALADRYAIERELGQGGMATVYLAEDLRHHRKVAVKVLRPDLAASLGGARFLREIETTAQLTHPHILPLLDSGAADGTLFYVMPYVDGESLRDRLTREKQLSLEDALRIAREVADALGYAHSRGVIHRDIKPENILLESGHAVVADFGLARAVAAAGSRRLTQRGLAVGTPAYMSPEQAAGSADVDGRSDLYSLGCVLYEMLGGEPPYVGITPQSVIAKKLSEPLPRISVVRETVPEGVEAALAMALARIPADRWATPAEFAAALAHPMPASRPRWWRRRSLRVAMVVAGLALATAVLRLPRPASNGFAVGRSELLTAEPGLAIQPALSPDGKLVAYSAGTSRRMRIYIRPVSGGRTIPLTDDTTAVETQPRWSPDGLSLLFLTRGGVSVAAALGGSSRPLVPASATGNVSSAAWSPDGAAVAFVRGDSLLLVAAAGGEPRFVGGPVWALHSCAWSPNGRWIACVAGNSGFVFLGTNFGNTEPSTLVLFPARGGPPIRLLEQRALNQSPVWSRDGARLFFISNRDGPRDIYVLALSASGRPRGAPVRLTTGLGAISLSLSADGRRLAYAVYTARSNIWSVPVPTGAAVAATASTATQLTTGRQAIESMSVSRDGRWLLYDSDLRGNSDIYRVPIGGGRPEQLTRDPADEFAPDLSPDGRAVAYHSFRSGTRDIEAKPLDGGPNEQVTSSPGQESFPKWSPDGRALAFYDQGPCCTTFIARRGTSGSWSTPDLVAESAAVMDWSPDGRELALMLPREGRLFVMPLSGGRARTLVDSSSSRPLASTAVWRGRTIYFKARVGGQASFWAVSARGGRPRLLVRFPDPGWQSSRQFFATDGRRLYFPVEDRQSDIFVAELRQR